MRLGLTTQLQRQVGTQIAKLIIFAPPRVNLNKRNSIHPYACVLTGGKVAFGILNSGLIC